MRVVLVEPYYGGSHKAWADGYAASSEHDITMVTLPARFWKWRMHGAFLTLADALEDEIAFSGMPDVILASSMMNVAAFAGAVRTIAPGVPIAVYFHESQFTYPLSPADKADAAYPMKNWSSAAIADLVIFNSEFHRSVFRVEARKFLNAFPEYKHVGKVDNVVDASIVLPVGIDVSGLDQAAGKPKDPPLIVWNHRWEHDKGPDELKDIVSRLIDSGMEFEMAMCGEVFVSVPEAYRDIVELLGDRLIQSGWADQDQYLDILNRASVVLSTAGQEFFGIAITEAVAAGAHPVFPNRLVYPERIADFNADAEASLYDSAEDAIGLIEDALRRPVSKTESASASLFAWKNIAPRYDKALSRLVPR